MSEGSHVLFETLARVGGGAVFALVALALGDALLAVAERVLGDRGERGAPLARFGTSLLVGFGTAGSIGVALGYVHLFYRPLLLAIAAVAIALRRRELLAYARAVSLRGRPVVVATSLVAAAVFAVNWVAALAPPTRPDELAYHLPQAQQLVDEHRLAPTAGGAYDLEHLFYGNLPKLAEALYAEGIAFGGAELGRSLHLLVLGAFLLLAAGVVRALLGGGAAALGVLLVLLHDELLGNATSAYVDAAAGSFEAGAVFAAAMWLERRGRAWLAPAALLVGFGLGVKYSAAFTALFLAVVLVLFAGRWWSRRAAAVLGSLAVAAGGLWYLKNLVRYGNPLYPFYLGHDGLSEAEYESLVEDVRAFRYDRTPVGFVRFPSERWQLVGALPTFAAAYVAPLGALVPRARSACALLAAYAVSYAAYWYFLSSHQTRFLFASLMTALVLLAVVACHLRPLSIRIAALAAALVVFASVNPYAIERAGTTLPDEVEKTFRPEGSGLALGRGDVDAELSEELGCGYDALRFLRERDLRGAVLDNWSRWGGMIVTPYEGDTPLRTLPPRALAGDDLRHELDRQGVRYVFVDEEQRARALARSEGHVREHTVPHERAETQLLRRADEIWRRGTCRLYRLDD